MFRVHQALAIAIAVATGFSDRVDAAFTANFIDGSLLANGSSDGAGARFDFSKVAGAVLANSATGGGSTGSGLVNAIAQLNGSITTQGGVTTIAFNGFANASLNGDTDGFGNISISTDDFNFTPDPIILQLGQTVYYQIENSGSVALGFSAISGSISDTQLAAGTYQLTIFLGAFVSSFGTPVDFETTDWKLHLSETPFGESLLGDINGDNTVDGADLGLLLGAWNTPDPDADLNNDNTVDGADLGLLLGAWST